MTPEDRVLDHYEHPYNRSPWEMGSDFTGVHANEECGDYIVWWGHFDTDKRITGLWWEGEGCCFSQAIASMLAEHCEAKRLYEVRAFTQDDVIALFGIDVEPGRIECVMVAYHALQKALEKHDE